MFTVVIPWRSQPHREQALRDVRQWYAEEFPEAELRLVDSDDAVFNLARCRNLGVASLASDDSIVVLGDADTIPERAPLVAAVEAARTSGVVHLPYERYHWLGPDGSEQFRAGSPLAECAFTLVEGACSGVYVTTKAAWVAHGGQDERFRGWGFEDAAWNLAHTALLGAPPRRHAGRVYALHHVAEVRHGPQYEANAALMERYRAASASAPRMRELIAERDR